jgi:hypothetical protein
MNTKKRALPAKTVTFETVRQIGLELPDVEEGTTHGFPALKIKGKLFAWMPVKKNVEPNTLAIRLDFDQRDALITEAPDIYYLTDHYLDYPSVLVRLGQLDTNSLQNLLRAGWRFVTNQKQPKGPPRRR